LYAVKQPNTQMYSGALSGTVKMLATDELVEGEKTGDGISYASHVKNPNPLKARATTFYDPVHNALDKEAQCVWKEREGSDWPSVYIQKPFMTL
jgi:hypothetical protein